MKINSPVFLRGCLNILGIGINIHYITSDFHVITFRVRRSRGEILVTAVSVFVCLSVAAFPHYCADPDVSWGVVGVPSSCALLGGFAIDALVSLL